MRPACRQRCLAHARDSAAEYSRHHALRRAERLAQAGGRRRPSGPQRIDEGDMHSLRRDAGVQLGRHGVRGDGRGRRARRCQSGGGCAACAGAEHEALQPVRPQLRVLLRRPVPLRQAGGGFHPRRAEAGCICLRKALRGERAGAAADALRQRDGRADAAGNVPDELRDCHQRGQAGLRDDGIQPRQRRVRQRKPPSAGRYSARRVGL